jgi:dipeptidase E
VYQREADDMRSLGFDAEELDLRQYFHGRGDLRARLETLALVWVVGGNAFVLARAMTAAGFGPAAHDRLEVYAGYSAGACVAGPDLEGIQLMDDPDFVPAGYQPEMPARTLGLVPWRIVPHWRSDHPESENAERAVRHLQAAGLPYRGLRDGEAIVIDAPGDAV